MIFSDAMHTTLGIVEELDSNVPAGCYGIPNLIYSVAVCVRSL